LFGREWEGQFCSAQIFKTCTEIEKRPDNTYMYVDEMSFSVCFANSHPQNLLVGSMEAQFQQSSDHFSIARRFDQGVPKEEKSICSSIFEMWRIELHQPHLTQGQKQRTSNFSTLKRDASPNSLHPTISTCCAQVSRRRICEGIEANEIDSFWRSPSGPCRLAQEW
jgi:uncharacterized protein YecA (UPF0149 family)